MERLYKAVNDWNSFDGEDMYEGPEQLIMEAEVMNANRWLKSYKTVEPTELVVDSFKNYGTKV